MDVAKGAIIAGPAGAVVGAVNWLTDVPFVKANELLKTVNPGDLIEFNRGSYMHWAMYSDKPGYIINVPAESKNDKKVTITVERLLDVAGDSGVRVNNQDKVASKLGYKRRSNKAALEAAKSDIGKTLVYDFKSTNCEYYCTLWLYGKGFSTQVNQATIGLWGTGATAQIWGGKGALIGGIVGGPAGALLGYAIGTGVVGGFMSVVFEAAGNSHYTR